MAPGPARIARCRALDRRRRRSPGSPQGHRDGRPDRAFASVRADVDAFEVAVGGAPGFANPNAATIVSALEDSQSNDDLATRLVTLFNASVDPLVGLACLVTIDLDRARAALQANLARTQTALARLTTRLAGVAIPANLAPVNASSRRSGRRPRIRRMRASRLRPRPRDERRAHPHAPGRCGRPGRRRAAGRPPPAFVEAGYYSDMIEALHRVATGSPRRRRDEPAHVHGHDRRWPGRTNRGGGQATGGRPVRRVRLVRRAADDGRPNLFDQSARPGNPRDVARWFVVDSGYSQIVHVDESHNAFGVARANEIRLDVIDHYTDTPPPPATPRRPVSTPVSARAPWTAESADLTDRMWPGMQSAGRVFITPREGCTPAQTRSMYWDLFKTCIHEYLHTTANGTYTTWYEGLTDPHHKITYQEGFTDWFTLKTWRSVFPEEVASNTASRTLIQGSADADVAAARGDPSHYPEMAEAQQLEAAIGLPNMRAAYFRGNTAVLVAGGFPSREHR